MRAVLAGTAAADSASIVLNRWTHWGISYDGANVELWKDGVSVASAAKASWALSTSVGFGIGNSDNAAINYIADTYNWPGFIDDVLIIGRFDRSLPMMIYRHGRGGWATPRRRRWNYATAQTAIPYWIFARKNARLIGGGVS